LSAQERGLEALTGRAKLAAPDDTLVLEDASARMALRGAGCPAGPLVTGVVAAVRGAAAPGGDFDVKARLAGGTPLLVSNWSQS